MEENLITYSDKYFGKIGKDPGKDHPSFHGRNPIFCQFDLLEQLMTARIKQQEMLRDANRLPKCLISHLLQEKVGVSLTSAAIKATKALESSLKHMLELQMRLMQQDMIKSTMKVDVEDKSEMDDDLETNPMAGKQNGLDCNEEIVNADIELGNTDGKMSNNKQDFENWINNQHIHLKKFRINLIREFDEKIKFVQSSKQDNFKSLNFSDKQVKQILLVERSQTERPTGHSIIYKVFGKEGNQLQNNFGEFTSLSKDEKIFDDSDFYMKLITSIMMRKATGTKDMIEIGRRWAEINNLKSKSLSKSIKDHKATKGRKTRYNVLTKILGLPDIELVTLSKEQECDAVFKQIFDQSESNSGKSWLFKSMES